MFFDYLLAQSSVLGVGDKRETWIPVPFSAWLNASWRKQIHSSLDMLSLGCVEVAALVVYMTLSMVGRSHLQILIRNKVILI